MTIFPEKCSDKLKITIFASLVYVALVIFTFSPTIEYGTYEWTTSQFLNAVRNFVILGPEALAYKASLMGGSDTSLH